MFFDDKIENKIALLIYHFAINAPTDQGCVINSNPYYINSIDSYNPNLTQSNSYLENKYTYATTLPKFIEKHGS